MTRLLIVRHAQSEWNAEGRWQGRADPPLSPAGEEQARAAGATLARAIADGHAPGPISAVWSSDLRRARDTAALLAAAAGWDGPLWQVHDLREHDVGDWSGLTHGEIEQRWPGLIEAWGAGSLAATPGGEPRDAFDQRVVRGIRHVLEASRAVAPPTGRSATPPTGMSVVVTHGGVLRAVARWTGEPERALSQLEGFVLVLAACDAAPLRHERTVSLLRGWDADGTMGRSPPVADGSAEAAEAAAQAE